MKSYLFKKIEDRFISLKPLNMIFTDSDSVDEKIRSTNLTLKDDECLELLENDITVIEKTQEIIDSYSLPDLKLKKIEDLLADYNYSKKIILQNGNTLVIDHDTPERGIFISHLEVAKRVEKEESSVLSYHQKVDNVYLGFTALTYIWNYLFFKKFTNKRPSLTLQAKRSKNKEIYDVKKLKIQNATSIQELEGIDWHFEDITIININVEAQKLLDDPKTPAYVIDAINDPSLKGEDGQIHLIQQL